MTRRGSALLVGVLLLVVAAGWTNRQGIVDSWHDRFGPQVHATLSVQDLPDGPLARRADASAVWTGREFIVWGGYASAGNFTYRNHADGAAYDPATKTWRMLAKSPLSGREQHLAVWTGKEMLVWGGLARTAKGMPTARDGAAYDPSTDTWRRIASAPVTVQSGLTAPTEVLWNGILAVVTPRSEGAAEGDPAPVLLYDLKADRWRELDIREGQPYQAVVYRGALAVAGLDRDRNPFVTLASDPDTEPRRLNLPVLPRVAYGLGLAATDRGLALLGSGDDGRTTIARWAGDVRDPLPGPAWLVRDVPADGFFLPVDLFSGRPGGGGLLDRRRVVVYGQAGVAAVDVTTGAYEQLDGEFCNAGAASAWTGTQVLAWGGQDCGSASVYAATRGHAYTVKITG